MRSDIIALVLAWTLILLAPPLAVAGLIELWYSGVGPGLNFFAKTFLPAVTICLVLGFWLKRFGTRPDTAERIRDREAFAAVALGWPLVVAIGSLPYWLGGMFAGPPSLISGESDWGAAGLGLLHSWFESMSGFTTTGATVIDASTSPNCIAGETPDCIQAQKRSLLLWRSITQWLGGMGVIMLGMLLLARYLGGGMSIARAELTGPSLSRLRPRLQQTAKVLWSIYTFFTFIEALLLKYVGKMSWFDAVNHALTTMPSGGFSTYSAGIMHFDSATIEWILITFMFISGVNFSIYHFILAKEWMRAFTDRETWVYILVLVSAWVAMALNLLWIAGEGGTASFRQAAFQATAIGTSTGYASADFASWPTLSLMVLLFLMIVGASAGSTSGGLKILRLRVAYQLAKREISRISSPRKVHVVRLDGEVVPDDKLWVIVGMLSWWAVLAMGSIVLLAILEPRLDLDSVLSAVVASLGNTGPALGTFGPTQTWSSLSAPSMFWVTLLMWAGRLELLTVLVLFHRGTWSRERKD